MGGPDVDDEPGPDADWDADDDPSLLDPASWPDDADDAPAADTWVDETDLDTLPSLDVAETEEDLELPADLPPLEDDLADLDAPDDTEMPILPWTLTVR
ncbi:MAG: hypothetical protein ABMB14_23895, partial [Myxococcota bacterium]